MPVNEAPDPHAFREFEHAGWESNVSEYEDAFARLTSQAIGPLLEAVDLRPEIRLLDIATGPGYVAAAAAARGVRVVGVDFSAPMVARARELNPAVEFQEGDAEALSFADASFDAVVMNFGILHLARPERAVNEAGISRFLNKPWEEVDLTSTVRSALEQWQVRDENRRLLQALEDHNRRLIGIRILLDGKTRDEFRMYFDKSNSLLAKTFSPGLDADGKNRPIKAPFPRIGTSILKAFQPARIVVS